MVQQPSALWLSVSPALTGFDRPLLKTLSQQRSIAHWAYTQTEDEAMSFEVAVALLHDYLSQHDRPVHLVGHGTSGLVGLLYTRQYPERVRSLTLLSVGAYPAVDWHAHYYAQLSLQSCARDLLLTRTVYHLFGYQSRPATRALMQVLDRDLKSALSAHTLYRRGSMFPGGVRVPLLVCAGQEDVVIDANLVQGWQPWLKPGDRLWQCPAGRYFFHYHQPQAMAATLLDFWQAQPESPCLVPVPDLVPVDPSCSV
jgi:pimeloyl-ACP methyl ester carboxylesterase